MNHEDVKRLQSAEYHNVEAMNPEPPQTVWRDGQAAPIEIQVEVSRERGTEYIRIRGGNRTVMISRYRGEKPFTTIIDTGLPTSQDIDTLIALLQRAQQIIQGGV